MRLLRRIPTPSARLLPVSDRSWTYLVQGVSPRPEPRRRALRRTRWPSAPPPSLVPPASYWSQRPLLNSTDRTASLSQQTKAKARNRRFNSRGGSQGPTSARTRPGPLSRDPSLWTPALHLLLPIADSLRTIFPFQTTQRRPPLSGCVRPIIRLRPGRTVPAHRAARRPGVPAMPC
jgi:hypothetical protein